MTREKYCFKCGNQNNLVDIVLDLGASLKISTICFTCVQKKSDQIKQIFYADRYSDLVKEYLNNTKDDTFLGGENNGV